jgi:predicted tellurium resistance membrane protein TerC
LGGLTDPQIWLSFLTLVITEIVLGIDNIVFITLLTGRLPSHQQRKGRIFGMGLALIVRILLLISISWVMTLTDSLFNVADWIGIHTGPMIAAVIVAMFFMLLASRGLSTFINEHPSVKLLALAFLLLIGVSLIAEGIDQPSAKGHIYFAMGFSIFVEALILKWSKKRATAAIQQKQKIKNPAS